MAHQYRSLLLCLLTAGCGFHEAGRAPQDISDGTIVATIDLNTSLPATSIALSPDGARAYVVASPEIIVVDMASYAITRRTRLRHSPWSVGVSRSDGTVYVVGLVDDAVTILDSTAERIVSTIDLLPQAPWPGLPRFATPPRANRVYLTGPGDDKLYAIETSTQALRSIGLPIHPTAIASTVDGSGVYIGGCQGLCTGGSVLLLGAEDTLRELAQFDTAPQGIAIDPKEEQLYVTTADGLVAINVRNGERLHTVAGHFGGDIAVAPGGDFLCVRGGPEQAGYEKLSVIETGTLTVSGTLPLHGGFGLALSPNGNLAYAPSRTSIMVV